MAIRTEDLNDQRHAMRPLKAILLGPFHMAGLTEGNRTINLDPSDIASAVTLPSSGPLLSLSDPANKELLLHVTSASSVGCQRLQGGSRAAALAATFTAVRVPVEEAYEGLHSGAEGEGGGERYVLESVLLPGRYLSLGRPKGSAGCDAAWALTPDRDAAASFERHAKFATSMSAGGENLGARSLQVTLSAPSAGKERLMPRALTLLPGATATYPKGARVLTGKTQKYLIVPIGQLIDEHYTGYWEFVDVAPSVAMGGSGAAGHGGGVEFA